MNYLLKILAMVSVVIIFVLGCNRADNSGLPTEFQTDGLIRIAGLRQDAVVHSKYDDITLHPETNICLYGTSDIKVKWGTWSQFLTNYQTEVIQALKSHGANIVKREPPDGGLEGEEGIFRYLYNLSGKDGMIKIVWGTYSTNHFVITTIFLENRE